MPAAPIDPASLEPAPPRLTWRILLAVSVFYLACLAIATYPSVLYLHSTLPSLTEPDQPDAPNLGDPFQHIWIMKWVKTCLVEGRSPLNIPDIQYPIGAKFAYFSPMHTLTAIYIVLSPFIHNDVLIYNIVWLIGIILTGLGTFVLAHWALGHLPSAVVAGMLGMLSGPMMQHSNGHLELLYVGFFPFFLVGWIRFVDAPSLKRLAVAGLYYVLLGASAAYFAIFAIFPATLYALFAAAAARRVGITGWLRARLVWALGFVAFVVPCLVALFASQVFATVQGNALTRPRTAFLYYGSPLWSYLVPTDLHLASKLLPFDIYKAAGKATLQKYEVSSYLGIVTYALIVYAALRRAPMRKARFFWAALALLVVLSLGGYTDVGRWRIYLPDWWLWKTFLPIRLTRVPARFNMMVGICAAVIAGAGLRAALERFRRPRPRALFLVAVVAVAMVDIVEVGFPRFRPPTMPACFRAILARDPAATFLEVPVFPSFECRTLVGAGAYWQLAHHAPTSSGYSGLPNIEFDHRIAVNSPFAARFLEKANGPQTFSTRDFGIISDVQFLDYAWLYLQAHDFRYVVVHHDTAGLQLANFDVAPLEKELGPYRIYDDRAAAVYDRALLKPPGRPAVICDGGFHPRHGVVSSLDACLERNCGLVLYNPDPQARVRLRFEACAFRSARIVKLLDGPHELARWEILPGPFTSFETPPIPLTAGIHQLTIQSDGQDRPSRRHESILEEDYRPYSLLARNLRVERVEPSTSSAADKRLAR